MTAELEIPPTMSDDAGDLLTKLLDRNDETRLQEPVDIKAHPFFSSLDWDMLLHKKITPFIPEVGADDDTSNIDPAFTEAPIEVGEEEDGPIPASLQGEFEGFRTTLMHQKIKNVVFGVSNENGKFYFSMCSLG